MQCPLITDSSTNLQCSECNTVVVATDRFCGNCGREIAINTHTARRHEDILEHLKPTLVYYFITLILLATYGMTEVFPDGFIGMAIVSLLDVGLVIIFWTIFFKELKPLFSLDRIEPGIMALTVACAVVGAIVVTALAEVIEFSIQDDVYYSTYFFEDTSSPFLWAVFFICIQPAIFEEVAFRGFLYSNLEKVTTPNSAIYITAFVFGIIHLSIISMLWLVPLGLIFAYLRMKYNTLWYGIAGHFTYNFVITIIDFWGVIGS